MSAFFSAWFVLACSRNRFWDRSWTRRPIQWSISCRLRSVLSIPMHWLSCTSTRSRCRRPWEVIGRRRNFRFRISIFFLVKWSVNYFLRIYWVQIPIRRWLRDYHQRLVLGYCYWTFDIPSITTSESRLSQVYRGTTIEITSPPWWTTTRHKSLAFPLALSKMSSNILWSWSWMSLNLSPLQSSLSFISNVFSVALLLANTFFPFLRKVYDVPVLWFSCVLIPIPVWCIPKYLAGGDERCVSVCPNPWCSVLLLLTCWYEMSPSHRLKHLGLGGPDGWSLLSFLTIVWYMIYFLD